MKVLQSALLLSVLCSAVFSIACGSGDSSGGSPVDADTQYLPKLVSGECTSVTCPPDVGNDSADCKDSQKSMQPMTCDGNGQSPLSCTPYFYRPFAWNFNNLPWNASTNRGSTPPGFEQEASSVPASWSDPWMQKVVGAENGLNVQAFTAPVAHTDGYVFHGTDGAGLQSDCYGDIKYVEHFDPLATVCAAAQRDRAMFTHPATGTQFQPCEYWGGWNTSGTIQENEFGSKASGYWDSEVSATQPNISPGSTGGGVLDAVSDYYGRLGNACDEDNKFSFMLFPWVCNDVGTDPSTGMPNNNFSAPSVTASGTKCYVDNEPGSVNPATQKKGAPPYIEIIIGCIGETVNSETLLTFGIYEISAGTLPATFIGDNYEISPNPTYSP
ncbi:MAG: hypothetical protein OSB70_14755 [Myxococcota bacterium]|nr:hypothetical protein [Myxococcota bacterium]